MIGIYQIKNLVNGKVYIGQSRNIASRWNRHRTDYRKIDSAIYRAIRKYGLENFEFSVLEECSIEQLDEREIYWIKEKNSYKSIYGYNLTEGGSFAKTSMVLTEEQVLEIYEKLKTDRSMVDIAKDYNVTYHTISDINTGQTWVHEGYTYPIRKHTKKYNYCIDCGKVITRSAIRCQDCYNKIKYQQRIGREELKSLIRTTPFTKIGEMYNVSDNAVRKWCIHFNLPSKRRDIKAYSDEEWAQI